MISLGIIVGYIVGFMYKPVSKPSMVKILAQVVFNVCVFLAFDLLGYLTIILSISLGWYIQSDGLFVEIPKLIKKIKKLL